MTQRRGNLGNTFMDIEEYGNFGTDKSPMFRFNATTIKLNDIIPFINTVNVVLKIDVESFECYVINGGKVFFAKLNGTVRRFAHTHTYTHKFAVTFLLTEWSATKGGTVNKCVSDMITYLTSIGLCPYHLDNTPYSVGNKSDNIMWVRQHKCEVCVFC
jgi:hypothetical protein